MRTGRHLPQRMVFAALGCLAGTALQLQQVALWPLVAYAAAASLAAVLTAWALATGRQVSGAGATTRSVALTLGLVVLAFAVTGMRALPRLADALPATLEGRDLVLTGVVATLPRNSLGGSRFEFVVEAAHLDGEPVGVPRRVSLGWFRAAEPPGLLAAPPHALRAGERWRLPVRLRQPHGHANPHGFDLELWLFERGLRATGHVRVRQTTDAERLGDASGYRVARLRQTLRDRIAARIDDGRAAGVVAALAVGDQGAVDAADWRLFRATGVVHLMVISGLHVTLFAWLAAAAVGALWRRVPRLALGVPTPQAARWGGLLLAAAYAVLAGWGVPAQRTIGMLATVVLLQSLGLRWPLPHVLLMAALAVALGDPWALLQPGFWLSFCAVGLLLASNPADGQPLGADGWRARVVGALRGSVRTQAVVTLGLAPLTLLFFQQVSVVGFVANLVAIPLVTLGVTPLALAGVLWAPLWTLAAGGVQLMVALLEPLAAWRGAVWQAAAAPGWAVAAGALGGLLVILPLPWRVRALALPLLLPLLAPPPAPPAMGRFELVAADVGQGTAVLLRTRHHLLVYDAGPTYGPHTDAGERVLLPLLQARGEQRIDRLLLSHRDADHVGGAASLLRQFPVASVWSTLEAGHALRDTGRTHEACEAGRGWSWDGVRFEVLHPLPGDAAAPGLRSNALSCVLRVEDAAGRSVLLTGDIEAAQEAALVARAGTGLRSDVLMVPHHGSRTSSSAAFLETVAPRQAFVQAAYRSRFGHPAPQVLERYEARGIELLRSDRCGAWTWNGDGAGVCERERRRRYWHHRG